MQVRAAFLSDLHLGARECHAREIASFLRTIKADTLYLVGDVIDIWSMRRGIYWPASHHEVLGLILDKARNGTRVIYVPGNHDELARALCKSVIAGIEVHEELVHRTRRGQRMLVIHGDAFDSAVRFSPLLKATGSALYTVALYAGMYVNFVRSLMGKEHWSLATWIKARVGNAQEYVEKFEHAAATAAAERGLDGVICGHIHRPRVARIAGVLYCNDGDWVEHCTALIEDRSGEIRLWQHRERILEAIPLPLPLRGAA